MDAAVVLQAISHAAPPLADALVKAANDPELDFTPSDLARSEEVAQILGSEGYLPDGVLDKLLSTGATAHELEAAGVLTKEQLKRYEAIPTPDWHRGRLRLTKEAIDAARAAGTVFDLEYQTSWGQKRSETYLYASDPKPLRAVLEQQLAALEKAGQERHAKAEKDRRKQAVESGKAGAQGLEPAEVAKAQEAKLREAREVELAHHRNALLGQRATPDLFATLATSVPAAKALALLLLRHEDLPALLKRGERYTDPRHLQEEPRKNDTVKRTYDLKVDDLRDRVVVASTVGEALGPVLRAYALAVAADQRVVASSNRSQFDLGWLDPSGTVKALLRELLEQSGLTHDLDQEAARLADTPPTAAAAGDVAAPAGPKGKAKQEPFEHRTLKLIEGQAGITIPELADKLECAQNRLYRILPELQKAGMVRKEGRGWHRRGTAVPATGARS